MAGNVIGLEDIRRKMAQVKDDVRFKAGRKALRKAASIVVAAAKQNAESLDDPVTGRKIADNVAAYFNRRRFNSDGILEMRVGVRWGAESEKSNPDLGPGSKTFHWRFLELGTETIAERPFLRPALERNLDEVVNEFALQFNAELDKALK